MGQQQAKVPNPNIPSNTVTNNSTKTTTTTKNGSSNNANPNYLLCTTGNSLHFPIVEEFSRIKKKTIMSALVDDVELLLMGIYSGIRRGGYNQALDNDDFNHIEEKDGWLSNFPNEIILHILQFLDVDDIGRMQRVSRNFFMYWTRFEVLWRDLKRKSPMLYMFTEMANYENIKNVLLKRFVIDENVELPVGVQYILVGSSRCGKTTLIDRAFNQLPFSENYAINIVPPVIDKYYVYGNGKEFDLKIWDTYGNPNYRTLVQSVYSRANVFVYCFDLNCHKSFEELQDIYQEMKVKDISDYSTNDRCFILLGLKSDLEHQVTRQEIANFLKMVEPEPQQKTIHTTKVQYFELSSKEDDHNDLLFPFLYAVAILKTLITF